MILNKLVILFLTLLFLVTNIFSPVISQTLKKTTGVKKTTGANNTKGFDEVKDKNKPSIDDVDWAGSEVEELIPVNVKNEFDEEIKVKFDSNREYPVGPKEWITLGKRKPGRYTLTIYNKKGDFIDNLTKNIDRTNKFVLNENTISNAGKITGLSTGQKVAIAAGAVGATALGAALVNKALKDKEGQDVQQYVPPPQPIPPTQVQVQQDTTQNQVVVLPSATADTALQAENKINAFAPGGKNFKFLNTGHENVTLIVEGIDGNPIGNNWAIPKAKPGDKPQALLFGSDKITINPNQKIKVVIPSGYELQRYAFELEVDPVEGGYLWVVK